MSNVATQTPNREVVKIEAGRFSGALASFALGAFNFLRAYKVPQEVAHKIASDYAGDIGRGMSENLEIASKVGKAKNEGESVITFSGKTNAVQCTNAMRIIRVCWLLESLAPKKAGEGHFKHRPSLDTLPLETPLVEYLEVSKEWAARQTWQE